MDSHECVPPEVRTCSKCGTEKPLDKFGLTKGRRKSECKDCVSAYHKAYYAKNREKVIARTVRYQKENAEQVKKALAEWYKRNKTRILERCAEYRSDPEVRAREVARQKAYYEARKEQIQAKRKEKLLANPERQRRLREYQDAHYYRNKHLYFARGAKRRTKVEQATPAWADMEAIKAYYRLAAELESSTGVKHHVDHIVPLNSKVVCGLHVHNNLQVIPAKSNLEKSNRFEAG